MTLFLIFAFAYLIYGISNLLSKQEKIARQIEQLDNKISYLSLDDLIGNNKQYHD